MRQFFFQIVLKKKKIFFNSLFDDLNNYLRIFNYLNVLNDPLKMTKIAGYYYLQTYFPNFPIRTYLGT